MKIEFTEAPKGREYKVGDVVDFDGPIPEGYARKYINRGWAKEVKSVAAVKDDVAKFSPSKLMGLSKDDDKATDKATDKK